MFTVKRYPNTYDTAFGCKKEDQSFKYFDSNTSILATHDDAVLSTCHSWQFRAQCLGDLERKDNLYFSALLNFTWMDGGLR